MVSSAKRKQEPSTDSGRSLKKRTNSKEFSPDPSGTPEGIGSAGEQALSTLFEMERFLRYRVRQGKGASAIPFDFSFTKNKA